MKKVYVARAMDEEAIEKLKQHFEVDVNPNDRELTREELKEIVPHYHGILTMLSNKIDREIIDLAEMVEIFADYSVGYNNFDVEYAKEKGIMMTNTPGVLTDATADLAFALFISAARRVVEGDNYVREGRFKDWKPKLMLGKEIRGKTMGVIGFGRIGQAFAERARGFGVELIYSNRSRKPEAEERLGARHVSMEELLRTSDFISIHTPLTAETHHLIGEAEIAMMKDDVILVNTSRGPVIDEEAMIRALEDGKFFAVGLDVYEHEPIVPEALKKMDNVVIVPHIGSATEETRKKMAMIAVDNLIEVLEGRAPLTPVY